jgi:rRNA maturation protein Nop10
MDPSDAAATSALPALDAAETRQTRSSVVRSPSRGFAMKKVRCHHCGEIVEFAEKIFRNDTCPSCGSDLYCCLNCAEFSPSHSNQCREPLAERVSVKDRRNFCEYFSPTSEAGAESSKKKADEARAKLEALFSKKR